MDFEITPENILGRSIVIYGESGGGKSVFIRHILFNLRDVVPQIIAFYPSDTEDQQYSSMIPKILVHFALNEEKLVSIVERQEVLLSLYSTANNIKNLSELYKMKPIKKINDIFSKLLTYLQTLPLQSAELDDAKKLVNTKLCKLYKDHISENIEWYKLQPLSDILKQCLTYLNLNPNIVIVIDDCSESLRKMSDKSVALNAILTRGRHMGITLIVACHNDDCFKPGMRKYFYYSVFTAASTASAYFNRANNNFGSIKRKAQNCIDNIFSHKYKNRKLVYSREDSSFKQITAVYHPIGSFKCCSKVIWDYSNSIAKSNNVVASNNHFSQMF